MAKINLNQRANVVLTEKGREVLAGAEQYNIHVTQEGKVRVELWLLMHVFGEHLFNGCDMPFVDAEIVLEPL